MKMINRVFFVLSVVLLNGCSIPFEDDNGVPLNIVDGNYTYSSKTEYFDAKGVSTNSKTNQGSIFFSTVNFPVFNITPIRGWGYSVNGSKFENHVLSDGSVVQTFKIILQGILVNEKSFNVVGAEGIELIDPDGTVVGRYDGIIDANGNLEFDFLSFDLQTGEKVSTRISADEI